MANCHRKSIHPSASTANQRITVADADSCLKDMLGDSLLMALKDCAHSAGRAGVPLASVIRASVVSFLNSGAADEFEENPHALKYRSITEDEELSLFAAGGLAALWHLPEWTIAKDGPQTVTEDATQRARLWQEAQVEFLNEHYSF